jgi:uncharacterized coiled-coil protein SlyX
MINKDPNIVKLEKQLAQLEQVVKMLSVKVAYLERENSRRKSEMNQVTTHLRK